MNKELKDYIHYYIGQTCTYDDPYYNNYGLGGVVTEKIIMFVRAPHLSGAVTNVKPHLRRLEDMTEEECWDIEAINPTWVPGTSKEYIQKRLYLTKQRIVDKRDIQPEVFHYLLSKGFDLFNLIESGAAIDAKTIQPQQQ